MRFADLAASSERVAGTSRRSDKIALLGACIGALPDDELAAGVHYLAGEIRQGKLGVGCLGGAVAPSSWTAESHTRFLWPEHLEGPTRAAQIMARSGER